MSAINTQSTLWETAYGVPHGTKIPAGEIKNLAAHEIIKNDKQRVLVAKVLIAVGTLLLLLGLVLVTVYSQFPPTHSVRVIKDTIDLGCCTGILGLLFIGIGAFVWYRDSKRLEEAQTKSLMAIKDRLGADLSKLDQRERKNVFKEEKLEADMWKLYDALASKEV